MARLLQRLLARHPPAKGSSSSTSRRLPWPEILLAIIMVTGVGLAMVILVVVPQMAGPLR